MSAPRKLVYSRIPEVDVSKSGKSGQTRREFARTLTAAAAAPLVVTRLEADAAAAPVHAGQQTTTPPVPGSRAMVELVRERWGDRLSEEQMASITRSVEGRLRAAERMREFKLNNWDEPAFAFSAD